MKKMRTVFIAFVLSVWSLAQLIQPAVTLAADFRSAERLDFKTEDVLSNAYLAGNQISIRDSQIEHDLVLAADQATINGSIKGGLLAAARILNVQGSVSQSVRLAAGEATIGAEVGQDVVMWAGQAIMGDGAKVGGDVIFSGSKLIVNGQVTGKVVAWCECEVEINGQIGSFEGYQVRSLSFGQQAIVEGNVVYQSQTEASIDQGADIKGQVDWQPVYGDQAGQRQVLTSQLFYGTVASLIFCFAIAYFLRRGLNQSLEYVQSKLWWCILAGLVALVVGPIAAVILLLPSIWLGISIGLLFILLLLSSFFVGQILLGWWLLQWWYGRANQGYTFDWRAPLIGALIGSLCLLVPLVGPILLSIFAIIALGSMVLSLLSLRK